MNSGLFSQEQILPCLFFGAMSLITVYVLVYVDDIIIIASSQASATDGLIQLLYGDLR